MNVDTSFPITAGSTSSQAGEATRMRGATRALFAIVTVVVLASSCASGTTDPLGSSDPLDPGDGVASSTDTEAGEQRSPSADGERCRADTSFRARLVESDPETGETLTEYRYEVNDAHVREEAAGAGSGQVIVDSSRPGASARRGGRSCR